MPPFPVRVGRHRLQPALAESYPWECARHIRAGEKACKSCCGGCFFLSPGLGCELGHMKPVRCQTYPLIPQKDRVLVHGSCPEAKHFVASLAERDPRALALLDMAVAMSDCAAYDAEDHSLEIDWLLSYTKDGFGGRVVWKRGVGLTVPAE